MGTPNQRCFFPRGRRDWGDHGRRIEDERAWQGAADGGMIDRGHKRWQGKDWLSGKHLSVRREASRKLKLHLLFTNHC